jgi:uncharacterized delta-60 repeat protein
MKTRCILRGGRSDGKRGADRKAPLFSSCGFSMSLARASAALALLLLPARVWALAWDVDYTSFGTDGIVTTSVGEGAAGNDVAIDDSGRIIVVGTSREGTTSAITIVGYTSSGSLDGTFGTGGIVKIDLGLSASGEAVAIDPSGRIVVAGNTIRSNLLDNNYVIVARYGADGSEDRTFGSGGVGFTLADMNGVDVTGLAIDHSGRIVVVGTIGGSFPRGIFVARYSADGSLDATFGTGGVVRTLFEAPDVEAFCETVAIDATDRIVVVGTVTSDAGGVNFERAIVLVRYTTNGNLDSTFGGGAGVRRTRVFYFETRGRDVAIDPSGRILVAGWGSANFSGGTEPEQVQSFVVRYKSDGTRDVGFGNVPDEAVATIPIEGGAIAEALALDHSGRIAVAFRTGLHEDGSNARFGVMRYTADGLPDAALGNGGTVTTQIGTGALANAVATDSSDRIVVAGKSGGGASSIIAARYVEPPVCRCQNPLFISQGDGLNDGLTFARGKVLRECRSREGSYHGQLVVGDVDAGPLTFGPDGNLYVVVGHNSVVRYDPGTGASLGTLVPPDSGGLNVLPFPASGISFGPDGDLYVSAVDSGQLRVRHYDSSTGAFIGNFTNTNVSFGKWGADELFYGFAPDGTILRFDANGAAVPCFLPPGAFDGFDALSLEPVGASSVLYVADFRGLVHSVLRTTDPLCPIVDADDPLDGFRTCYPWQICEGLTCAQYMGPLDMTWGGHPGIDANPNTRYLYALNRQALICDPGDVFDGVTVVDLATPGSGRLITPSGQSYTGIALQPPPDCDDGNPCTADTCDDVLGCQHTPLTGTWCDDDDVCTTGDTCQNGTCVGGPPVDCNATAHQCWYSPGCDPRDGCIYYYAELTSCDDGNPCTTTDRCCGDPAHLPPGDPDACPAGTTGGCFGRPYDCDDHNPCTADSCDGAGGCVHRLPDCLDNDPCTADSCDPGTGSCQHTTVATTCEGGSSTEGFIGGPDGLCTQGVFDAATNTCTLSTPTVALSIPIDAFPAGTNINVVNSAPNPTSGACAFALRNANGRVTACVQLEPSGQSFATPVEATFKWVNQPSGGCTDAACCVVGTDLRGETALREGTLQVVTQGRCVPVGNENRCETTNTLCGRDDDCLVELTPRCGAAENSECPSGPTLEYASCTSPCVAPAACGPGSNTWTVQLSHFSAYALAALNHPPDCSAAVATPDRLWPPNHKYAKVAIGGVTDPDDDPVTITIDGITQDEPLDSYGDGHTCPDGAGVGTDIAVVRAERAMSRRNSRDGRVYHIAFTAEDGKGGQCEGTVSVCVPPKRRAGATCVDEGPLFDATGPCE